MHENGHVIPGLNESWTLMGAKLNEWNCGFVAFLMCQGLFEKPTRAMPILIAIMVGTALGLATLRRRFPDEEKGMRNYAFMLVGMHPPGIPAPAKLQPMWSGAPLRELHPECDFVQLGLHTVLGMSENEDGEKRS